MTDELKVVVLQENAFLGDFEANRVKIKAALKEHNTADLVVFPECFITGYPLQDLVLRPDFIARVEEEIQAIKAMVIEIAGPALLVGAPQAGSPLPYNSAYLIEPNGQVRTVQKRELPNNDVFDERRTFTMGSGPVEPLLFKGFRLGVMICEDMWHGAVARGLADELADVLIVLNGSPYQGGKQALREEIAQTRVRQTGLPLIYVNLVGGQDELVFDGGSFVCHANGQYEGLTAFKAAKMELAFVKLTTGVEVKVHSPMPGYIRNTIVTDYLACVTGLRDYLRKTGHENVVLGVSGGLDSALVAAMAVDALGPENVTGIMMPSRFTSQESIDLAEGLMRRLGMVSETIPIGDMHSAASDGLGGHLKSLADKNNRTGNPGITDENLQARLRGMTLMAVSNYMGGILLTTGNKSEMSVGYCTLYGDMNGGFNPLKSVYKSRAFKMAEWRNSQGALLALNGIVSEAVPTPIPDRIITRPPSAELAEGQSDEASLGNYDALDLVLQTLIEDRGSLRTAEITLEKRFGADRIDHLTGDTAPDYVRRIARLVDIAQYKRDQACPGVKLNPTDFGLGWRFPIAGKSVR